MPLRGILLVLAVAVVMGIACRKEMYIWFKNLTSDPSDSDDPDESDDPGTTD